MFRLRVVLGVASSLVAVAALTIVFAGTGEAQGNGVGPNVRVVNTPLPVTGDVTATISGNMSATILNPSENPVLIRDVDGQTGKQLWQATQSTTIPVGECCGGLNFDTVPGGKALIVEHVNVFYQGDVLAGASIRGGFNPPGQLSHSQYFVPQQSPLGFIVDATTKFYVGPGDGINLQMTRFAAIGSPLVQATATITGYLVNYP